MAHSLNSHVSSDVGLVYWRWKEEGSSLVDRRQVYREFNSEKGRGRGATIHNHRPTENVEPENDLRVKGKRKSG